RRHTRCLSDWSSDVCSSDLPPSYHPDNSRKRVGREKRLFSPSLGEDWPYEIMCLIVGFGLGKTAADMPGHLYQKFGRCCYRGFQIGRASCRERVEVTWVEVV